MAAMLAVSSKLAFTAPEEASQRRTRAPQYVAMAYAWALKRVTMEIRWEQTAAVETAKKLKMGSPALVAVLRLLTYAHGVTLAAPFAQGLPNRSVSLVHHLNRSSILLVPVWLPVRP